MYSDRGFQVVTELSGTKQINPCVHIKLDCIGDATAVIFDAQTDVRVETGSQMAM